MSEKIKIKLFLLFAIIFVGLAISGGIRGYSPVPFWDMWDGYLNFYVKAISGDWSVWWAQHNEHRIILARILFFLDLSIFEGRGWFLLIINYFLISIVCLLFWKISKEVSKEKQNWIGLFLVSFLFSWSQRENLEWGFQSQFILAQLLPLSALFFLSKAIETNINEEKLFISALALGWLSIGSMANGVLALPIMTAYAALIRMKIRRTIILGLSSLFAVLLYFYGYTAPTMHGSLAQAINSNPIGLLHYVAVYLGGPFSFGSSHAGLWTASIAGCFMIVSCFILSWRLCHKAKNSTLPLALLAFIFYIGGTALGTAGGRLIFGVDQALSSRYSTPSLMAWAALLLLYTPSIYAMRQSIQRKIWIPFAALLTLMLPIQLETLNSQRSKLFERHVAALAIELGIKDQTQISTIFHNADVALSLAKIPVEHNFSIFGLSPIAGLRERINQQLERKEFPTSDCSGYLDEVQLISEDDRFLRIRGWIFDSSIHHQSQIFDIINTDGKLVGFALSGGERPDVALKVNEKAGNSGFKGYIFSKEQGQQVYLISKNSQCRLPSYIPIALYNVSEASNLNSDAIVKTTSILDDNEWLGKDYEKTNISGIRVLGSYINSDSDVGSVSLSMKRGDQLLYRSGPTTGNQIVEILGSGLPPVLLPITTKWKLLEFSGDSIPAKFIAKFSDRGKEWGEWSAIGIGIN